jgi:branched-chain amino acid transport system ATP-binding protein
MLELRELRAGYSQGDVLKGVSFALSAGGFAALLGGNGAGKSTTLKTIAGLMRCRSGQILLDGKPIGQLKPSMILRCGLALVPEGRKVFAAMSVRENLEMGGYTLLVPRRRHAAFEKNMEFVCDLFPRLGERATQPAGTLSGGEQQMLAIGRALMSNPRILLLDEPSMGLSPLVASQIFVALDALRKGGLSLLVCEQNATLALRYATEALVLQDGQIAIQGTAASLRGDPRLKEAYLGA